MFWKLRLPSAVRVQTLGFLLLITGCGDSEHDQTADAAQDPLPGDGDAGWDSDADTLPDASLPRIDYLDGAARDAGRDTGVAPGPDASHDGSVSDASPDGSLADAAAATDGGSGTDASACQGGACVPVCGNGAVEPGEECEPISASDPNCTTSCARPALSACMQGAVARGESASDPCVLCGCDSCAAELGACLDASDVASAGPASGTSRGVLCAAVVECGRDSGCTGDACFCGTASTLSCGFGGANGPCKSQLEKAAETTSAITVSQRKTDTRYAVGRANAVSECTVEHCSTQCGL